jgi:NAD(P)H-dependent FMN reductase
MIKVGVVSGSSRLNSQSRRVAGVCIEALGRDSVGADLIDLSVTTLPDPGFAEAERSISAWRPISDRLRACDGFILVVPEWGGMAPPAVKNLLALADGGELAHRPVLLVGVSSSGGGFYPLAEVRMAAHKNTRLVWLPEQVVLRSVESRLTTNLDPPEGQSEQRLLEGLRLLAAYAEVLKPVRDSLAAITSFPFGN